MSLEKSWEDKLSPEDRARLEQKRLESFPQLRHGYSVARVINERSGILVTNGPEDIVEAANCIVREHITQELYGFYRSRGEHFVIDFMKGAYLPKTDYWQRKPFLSINDIEFQENGMTFFAGNIDEIEYLEDIDNDDCEGAD